MYKYLFLMCMLYTAASSATLIVGFVVLSICQLSWKFSSSLLTFFCICVWIYYCFSRAFHSWDALFCLVLSEAMLSTIFCFVLHFYFVLFDLTDWFLSFLEFVFGPFSESGFLGWIFLPTEWPFILLGYFPDWVLNWLLHSSAYLSLLCGHWAF